MKLFGKMSIDQNRLRIGKVDLSRLKEEYGTPLYIYDEEGLTDNIKVFKENFKSEKFETRIIYASKAFSSIYILRLMDDLGLYVDVVSGGEIHTALQAGIDSQKLYFHGNNKTDSEIIMAMEEDIGTLIIDNKHDLNLIDKYGQAYDKKIRVLLRVNPGIEAQTHKYIQTSTDDSKFGMSTKDTRTMDLIKDISQSPYADLAGIHCHIGSQVFDKEFFFEEADLILNFVSQIQEDFNIHIEEVNLGGGFGSYYTDQDPDMDIGRFLQAYIRQIEKSLDKYGLSIGIISIEPGRSLVNNFGHTLYTVGSVKETLAGHPLVLVDGGMSDNPRYALYGAKYKAVLPMKMDQEVQGTYRIGGKLCESGDILIDQVDLAQPEPGDLILVPYTGAYNYSMASNYNMMQKPAVVFVKQGNTRLAIKRETFEDLIRNHIK